MGTGNHLAIDLSPESQGTVGQVINFGADDSNHFQIARNFTELLKFTLEMYQAGKMHDKFFSENEDFLDLISFQGQKFAVPGYSSISL